MLVLLVACATTKGDDLERTPYDPNQDNASVPSVNRFNAEGTELYDAGKYAEASAKFREAVARVPEPFYFFNLCMSLWREGKRDEALQSCEAVAKNQPTPALQAKTDRVIARIRAGAK
jgi:tetratricopeptide (TPR) repeat protein